MKNHTRIVAPPARAINKITRLVNFIPSWGDGAVVSALVAVGNGTYAADFSGVEVSARGAVWASLVEEWAFRSGNRLVWSPDSQRLAYVQAQPRTSNLPPTLSVMEVPSRNIQQTNLPAGNYSIAWKASRSVPTSDFPRFTPPVDWLIFFNPNPPYEIRYTGNAVLDCYVEKLTIRLPIQPGTQMIEKQFTIEPRTNTVDGCYSNALWEGKTLHNGLEMKIRGGKQWESAPGGQSFRLGYYASYHRI